MRSLKLLAIQNELKKSVYIIPIIIGGFLPIIIWFFMWNTSEENKAKSKLFLPEAHEISNQILPNSKLINLDNIDFSERIRNGKVLLVFLSTKCEACMKDIELLSDISPKVFSQIEIYGVFIDDKATIIKFINEKKLPFTVLVDENSKLFSDLRIRYFPTKFVINNGVIEKTLFGNFLNEKMLMKDLQIREIE